MPNRRILLMHISINSGHHRASLAVEKAIRMLKPETEILNINSFNYTNPVLEKIINKAYMGMIRRTPDVWEYLYDNPKVVKRTKRLKYFIHKFNSIKLRNLFNDFKPDVIACTQAFPCGMVADYKKTYGVDMPLVGILTDYTPHSYWLYDEVDYFIVPSEDAKKKLVRDKIAEEKIKIFGIPIDPGFNHNHNGIELLEKLNLNPSLPVVLIMGGSQGMGPIKKLVWSLNRKCISIQIVVVAGSNRSLGKWLRRKSPHYQNKTLIFEYVNNINELMRASTLIITKPGGLTTAEALSCGLPIVIIKPIPGQEAKNTQFLLQQGVAIEVTAETEITKLIEGLLKDQVRLEQMKSNARRLRKPNAAFDTAELLFRI